MIGILSFELFIILQNAMQARVTITVSVCYKTASEQRESV